MTLEGRESVFDTAGTSELLRNSNSSWSGSGAVRLLTAREFELDWKQTQI